MAVMLWGATNSLGAPPLAIGRHSRAIVLDKLSFIAPLFSHIYLSVERKGWRFVGTHSDIVSFEVSPARHRSSIYKFTPTKYIDQNAKITGGDFAGSQRFALKFPSRGSMMEAAANCSKAPTAVQG